MDGPAEHGPAAAAEGALTDAELRALIDQAWDDRDALSPATVGAARDAVDASLDGLDTGRFRVAEPGPDGWIVHQWLKKAVLLSFRLHGSATGPGVGGAPSYDKVPQKFGGWDERDFAQAGIRAVPGAVVRRPARIGRGVVLMPCFVNVGAHLGDNTMVDAWATIGSCAQVGADCHISGGAGIGGVLEPLQAGPVIVEDGCFIGARSEIAEGVVVGRGSVLGMGVFIGASTRIVDRATGAVSFGRVPPYSVVVPGTFGARPLPDGSTGPALACAVIVKTVDDRTRAKTAINELLRV